ncbi:hypothetical protein [Pseudomonas aeruginosa]|nr:hypothetical protein [Pseudomonas aeruginosa]
MAPKKRLKSAAAVYVPQTREQVISDIRTSATSSASWPVWKPQ